MTDEETRGSQDPPDQDPSDEDFAEAWEHGDDLDVGADTSRFEAFRGDDTAELLRRQVHDDPDGSPAAHAQPDPPSGGPNVRLVVGVLVVVFVIVAVLYLLN